MALPPEIWRQIAAHLTPGILKDLYSVNRTLFDLAMDVRYRDVRFEEMNVGVLDRIEALRYVSVCLYSRGIA